jgi:hypothetical protein
MLRWMPQGVIRRGPIASHCDADLACGHPGALRSIPIRDGVAIRYAKWRPQGVIRRGRFAAHYGPDLAYGHPGALRTIHMRSGFALRYAKIRTARDHPLPSPSFALRCTPGIRTSWCPAQHLNPQWACHAVRYAKMEAARGHPPRSPRSALRRRPGVRTSWCPAQQPDLRGRLASHCGPDVGCGHPGALHRIHIRNAFAKMVPARYHPPRSPRFALRRRCVRTS